MSIEIRYDVEHVVVLNASTGYQTLPGNKPEQELLLSKFMSICCKKWNAHWVHELTST